MPSSSILRFRAAQRLHALFGTAEFFELQPLPLGHRWEIVPNPDGVATGAAPTSCSLAG
jgi:hypothetical protein